MALGVVITPLVTKVPVIGAKSAPEPKTKIEVRANSFELPDVLPGLGFFVQLEHELTLKHISENKMNEPEAKIAAHKVMSQLYGIKFLKNIFDVTGASGYNTISIENVGSADDKNVTLIIDGIRFVTGIEKESLNMQREKDVIKINVVHPGDKIYLNVWTRERLFKAEPDRIRASSDAGFVAVSVQ